LIVISVVGEQGEKGSCMDCFVVVGFLLYNT